MPPAVLALETRGDKRFCEICGNLLRSAALAIRPYWGGSCNVRNCRCAQPCWGRRSNNVRDGTVGEHFHLPEGPCRRTIDGARVWRGTTAAEQVPVEHRFLADDRETISLAEILVTLGIGAVEDWSQSGRDPTKYASLTLQRWICNHGGATIDRRFDLDVSLSDRLVDYSDERGPKETLYLIVDPEAAAFAVLRPTLEFLEKIHPRLPATFFTHFVGSLNRWVRVYDFHDAEERVEMLREWYEGEANAEQYEVPDVEGCVPQCLKERPLSLRSLRAIGDTIRRHETRDLVNVLLELCRISTQVRRPEFTEDMGEQLMDSNPPLPCLLAAFSAGDAVAGCFDDEAETALETTPQPKPHHSAQVHGTD
jgi:hypothetical protein